MKPLSARQGRSRILLLGLSFLLLVAMTGCGEGEDATGNPLEGSRWEVTSVWDGTDLVAADPTTIATAVFSNGRAFGSTGCNLYQAPYSLSSDSITLGELAQTGSACDPAHAEQGDILIQAMRSSTRFILATNRLELTDASGATRVVFRPAAELPLTWVNWQLVWYGEGTAPIDGTHINLLFRGNGTLMGVAGCNGYSADYETDGAQLVIGAIAHTEMACMPDGVMTQETDYLNVLRRVTAFTTTLTGLELLDADGNPIAEYRFGGRSRNDGPTDGDHDLEDLAQANLIADAVKRLLTVDNGFDRADVFDDIRIATVIGANPDQPLHPLDLELIAGAASELGAVRHIDDADTEIQALFDDSPAGLAVVSIERIDILDDRAEVEMRLWCGSLCGVYLTYEAEPHNGGWNITGTTGPIAMS